MKKDILLIEDEDYLSPLPINRLKKYYNVEIARSIEAAKNILGSKKKIYAIILDIMMDPKPYSIEETNTGTETGWVYYKKELFDLDIPIIVWSRNPIIYNLDWGSNVKKVEIKDKGFNPAPDQLVNLLSNLKE